MSTQFRICNVAKYMHGKGATYVLLGPQYW